MRRGEQGEGGISGDSTHGEPWNGPDRARLLVARKAAASRLTAGAHYTRHGGERQRQRGVERRRGSGVDGKGAKKEVARAECCDGAKRGTRAAPAIP